MAKLAGLGAEVGGEFCGDVFGLNDSALNDELTASIGRKHCASGLNVFVTSRSADDVSSEWRSCDSDIKILMVPFSPMRYETSPGSIQTDNSAGRFSKISLIGTPLSRAARSRTASVGSPVFKHRNAEPCKCQIKKQKKMPLSHNKRSICNSVFTVGLLLNIRIENRLRIHYSRKIRFGNILLLLTVQTFIAGYNFTRFINGQTSDKINFVQILWFSLLL